MDLSHSLSLGLFLELLRDWCILLRCSAFVTLAIDSSFGKHLITPPKPWHFLESWEPKMNLKLHFHCWSEQNLQQTYFTWR